MFKKITSSIGFFPSQKSVLHNSQCPFTLELISDLVREDPSCIAIFKNSQGKFFAYHKNSLKEWYKARAQDRLQRTPAANPFQIPLQDLLTKEPLAVLNIEFINNECVERLLESYKINVSPLCFTQIFLGLTSDIIRSDIINRSILRLLSGALLALVIVHSVILFLNCPTTKEKQFEKIFNRWFEQTFVNFSPNQYQFAEEKDFDTHELNVQHM